MQVPTVRCAVYEMIRCLREFVKFSPKAVSNVTNVAKWHPPWHARARTKSSGRGWHWLEDPEETAWDPLARTPELTLP